MIARPIQQLVPAIEAWPEEDQVELADYARVIEARRSRLYVLGDEERAAIDEGLRQIDRGEFVDEHAIADLSARLRP